MISSKIRKKGLPSDSTKSYCTHDPFNKNAQTPQTMLNCSNNQSNYQSLDITRLLHDEVQQIPIYSLHQSILEGTKITQSIRAKIRIFLMRQCQTKLYQRQTCVLACYYVDLYFLNKGTVLMQEIQTLVISCLILACKFNTSLYPVVSSNICKKKDLSIWETKILKRLNFCLNPATYSTFAERIVFLWDEFVQREHSELTRFTKTDTQLNLKLRNFYEQLDLIYMTTKSLSYSIEKLTLNLFYLHVRKNSKSNFKMMSLLSKKECVRKFYQQDNLKSFFQKFIRFQTIKDIDLEAEIGSFLIDFVFWQTQYNQQYTTISNQYLSQMLKLDRLQTCPKDSYKIIKSLLKNNQKGQK